MAEVALRVGVSVRVQLGVVAEVGAVGVVGIYAAQNKAYQACQWYSSQTALLSGSQQ
jgi:hypothetical protein